MRKAKPHPIPSNSHKSQHSKTVIIQDPLSDSSSVPSSDGDELGGQSSSTHLNRTFCRLAHSNSTCGKRFEALIDSGPAFSVAHDSVYNCDTCSILGSFS